jgi:hypothetical protein
MAYPSHVCLTSLPRYAQAPATWSSAHASNEYRNLHRHSAAVRSLAPQHSGPSAGPNQQLPIPLSTPFWRQLPRCAFRSCYCWRPHKTASSLALLMRMLVMRVVVQHASKGRVVNRPVTCSAAAQGVDSSVLCALGLPWARPTSGKVFGGRKGERAGGYDGSDWDFCQGKLNYVNLANQGCSQLNCSC